MLAVIDSTEGDRWDERHAPPPQGNVGPDQGSDAGVRRRGLACVGIPFVVKISWPSVFCSAGAPAAHPAPSEIMESLRNLGRFPPLTPQRGRRGMLANPAFSPGEPAARRTKGDVDLPLHLP